MNALPIIEFTAGAYLAFIAGTLSTENMKSDLVYRAAPLIFAVILVADAIVRMSDSDTLAALEWWHATGSER